MRRDHPLTTACAALQLGSQQSLLLSGCSERVPPEVDQCAYRWPCKLHRHGQRLFWHVSELTWDG